MKGNELFITATPSVSSLEAHQNAIDNKGVAYDDINIISFLAYIKDTRTDALVTLFDSSGVDDDVSDMIASTMANVMSAHLLPNGEWAGTGKV